MAKPSTAGLLKEILSGDLEEVYIHITDKAVEWAVAGLIDETNSLLEQLWKFDIAHSRQLWLPDEGLQVLWTLSKKQPKNIPFSFKDLTAIEKENWSRNFYPCGDENTRQQILAKPFSELNEDESFFKAINAGYYGSEKPEEILKGLMKFINSTQAVGYSFFYATSCGALLAARDNLENEAENFIRLWGEGYRKYWCNYILGYLMRDRKCGRLLLRGMLAPVWGLSPELCQKETKEIVETLEKRMAKGRTLAFQHLSWKQLLSKISRLAVGQKTIDFPAEIVAGKSLSRPPATVAEIKEAEKRLDIVFPDDYKKFLLASNGFESFSCTGVMLSSVDKVDFFKNFDLQSVEIWAKDADPVFSVKLRSSLIIGGHEEEQQLLLIPLGNKNWECWHFSSWRPGEVIYPGFRFYMEEELQKLKDNFPVD